MVGCLTHIHTLHLNNKHSPTHTHHPPPHTDIHPHTHTTTPTLGDTADEMTVGVGDSGSQDLSPLTANSRSSISILIVLCFAGVLVWRGASHRLCLPPADLRIINTVSARARNSAGRWRVVRSGFPRCAPGFEQFSLTSEVVRSQ